MLRSVGCGHGFVGKNGFQMLMVCLSYKEKLEIIWNPPIKVFQGVINEGNFLLVVNSLESTPVSCMLVPWDL